MSDALIFDSGVGGLSVVAEIRRHLPWLALDYVCDNAALPYGTKRDEWLITRIVAVCTAACERSRPRALVVACNTASTLALGALRERLSIPVIGTVPAIKPAARVSRSRVIGVLATSATLDRPYLDRLIASFAADCRIVRVAADPLVIAVEHRLTGQAVEDTTIRNALEPLWHAPGLDTVVLGCTHFPLLRADLAAMSPAGIRWIDSGAAIARRLAQVLSGAESDVRCASNVSWATAAEASGLATVLARFGYAAPQSLEVETPAVSIG